MRTSGSGQSASQSSRLCHACLSVLKRKSFHYSRCYPHHVSLQAFIEASRMKCDICSWMLSVLPESDQETLSVLSEGRISNNMIATDSDGSISESRSRLKDSLQMRQDWLKWDSMVSFTGIQIRCLRGWEYHKSAQATLHIYLNPSYQGYFLPSRRVYDGWLRGFWEDMDRRKGCAWRNGLLLITHKCVSIRASTL